MVDTPPAYGAQLQPDSLDRAFADFVCRLSGGGSPGLWLAAVLVSCAAASGNSCICLDDVTSESGMLIYGGLHGTVDSSRFEPDAWSAELAGFAVVTSPGGFAPLVLDAGRRLYLHRYWHYEHDLGERLLRMASEVRTDFIPETLAASVAKLFRTDAASIETDWQRLAAVAAVNRSLTVIAGGPGTGKTTTVVKILALLLEQAGDRLLHIALAAPTGKAAARLIEAVCAAGNDLSLSDSIRAQIPQEAVTIHRLLRPLPGSVSFRYNAGNPLPFDVVVIDESSMVDLPLMAKLVAAIKPGSRLILLGDRDQLSSVEAGAVLGDICNHDWQNRFSPDFHAGAATIGGLVVSGAPAADAPPLADCVVTLWKSHRFSASSGIAAVSGLVNEGRGREALELMQSGTAGDIIWHELPSPDELPHRLKPVISEGYGPYLAETDPLTCLDRFGTFRIVTPIRQGPYGVQEVNAVTERILGLKKKVSGHDWYLYRPVMVSRNDYQLGLANGDTGLALPGENGEGMTVCFPTAVGGIRRFSTLALQSCDTVFTMTIHKSQGSEFDALLILLPPGCGEIMTRELLYTALTRGRKRVEIWGDSSSFIAGAARRTERNSGLRERLWGA